jgi:hypothetical protein
MTYGSARFCLEQLSLEADGFAASHAGLVCDKVL